MASVAAHSQPMQLPSMPPIKYELDQATDAGVDDGNASESANLEERFVLPGLEGIAADAYPLISAILRLLVEHREKMVAEAFPTIRHETLERARQQSLHVLYALHNRIDLIDARLPRISSAEGTALDLLAQVVASSPDLGAESLSLGPEMKGRPAGASALRQSIDLRRAELTTVGAAPGSYDPLLLSMELRAAEHLPWALSAQPPRLDSWPVLGTIAPVAPSHVNTHAAATHGSFPCHGATPSGVPVHGLPRIQHSLAPPPVQAAPARSSNFGVQDAHSDAGVAPSAPVYENPSFGGSGGCSGRGDTPAVRGLRNGATPALRRPGSTSFPPKALPTIDKRPAVRSRVRFDLSSTESS